MADEDVLSGLKKQVNLYQDLIELTKKENELVKQNDDISEIKEEKREIRDKIKKIDLKFDLDQTDKLRLIKKNDIEELNKFESVLRELYQLEKENQVLQD